MNILINASNLKKGGGLQVADSVCRELNKYPHHKFLVVYYKVLAICAEEIAKYDNVETLEFETPVSAVTIMTGRCKFLDELVKARKINAVLTIFGPSIWKPQVPHLSGFAQGHIVLQDSPFWDMLTLKKRIRLWAKLKFIEFSLNKSSDYYYTENPMITERLQKKFPRKRIFTVTNNANQVFYKPEQWDRNVKLPIFDGITLLTVAANYPHKNLPIIIPACHYLEEHFPELHFRFVLTINEMDMAGLDDCARKHIVFLGPVKIEQVPYLYEQCDVMFLPTLLECFSASYAEAMLMRKPILTSDLIFARGLCGEAALYYQATSTEQLGESIYRLSNDDTLKKRLIGNGESVLMKFDTYEQRAKKLFDILEEIVLVN